MQACATMPTPNVFLMPNFFHEVIALSVEISRAFPSSLPRTVFAGLSIPWCPQLSSAAERRASMEGPILSLESQIVLFFFRWQPSVCLLWEAFGPEVRQALKSVGGPGLTATFVDNSVGEGLSLV